MNDIRTIHREAMESAKKAFNALSTGDQDLFVKETEIALSLEREAASKLDPIDTSEPTRGVLFRSAATLAYNIGNFKEARELIELALTGKPFTEIKVELESLLKKVDFAIIMKIDQVEAIYDAESRMLGAHTISPIKKLTKYTKDKIFANIRTSKKDKKELFDVFESFNGPLKNFISRKKMIRSTQEIEDICQIAFIKLWENSEKISFENDKQVWEFLTMIAKAESNKSIKRYVVARIYTESVSEDVQELIKDIETAELFNSINSFIVRLPLRQARVIRLYYYKGLTIDQIAQELGISSNSVQNHLASGRLRIKEFIQLGRKK